MKKTVVILIGSILMLILTASSGCITDSSKPVSETLIGTWQDPNKEYTYVYMENGLGYISADNYILPFHWTPYGKNTWRDYFFDVCIHSGTKLLFTHGPSSYIYEGPETLTGGRWIESDDPEYWIEFYENGTALISDIGVEHNAVWTKGSSSGFYILYYQNFKKTGDNTYLQVSTGRTFTRDGSILSSEKYKNSRDGEEVYCQITLGDDGFAVKSEFGVRSDKIYSTSILAWREVFADGSISCSIACEEKTLQKDGMLRDTVSGSLLMKISDAAPAPDKETYMWK